MSSLLNDPSLEAILDRLHARSRAQSAESKAYFAARERDGPIAPDDADKKRFMSDKLVALDADKAEFCYQLCRALDARYVVEAGTSYGVSTLYLAAALRDNAAASGGVRTVVGTEYEPAKAAQAQAHLAEAGLDGFVDLRVGDLRETLQHVGGPIDFALIDIWTRMAAPALELIVPHLRLGAVVVCDNTRSLRAEYDDYFAIVSDPGHRLSTLTLPFEGGLEMTVRV